MVEFETEMIVSFGTEHLILVLIASNEIGSVIPHCWAPFLGLVLYESITDIVELW